MTLTIEAIGIVEGLVLTDAAMRDAGLIIISCRHCRRAVDVVVEGDGWETTSRTCLTRSVCRSPAGMRPAVVSRPTRERAVYAPRLKP